MLLEGLLDRLVEADEKAVVWEARVDICVQEGRFCLDVYLRLSTSQTLSDKTYAHTLLTAVLRSLSVLWSMCLL